MDANLLLFKTVIAGDSWGEVAVPVIQEGACQNYESLGWASLQQYKRGSLILGMYMRRLLVPEMLATGVKSVSRLPFEKLVKHNCRMMVNGVGASLRKSCS